MKKTSYNDFEFIRILGKGSFSIVYLVRRKEDKKEYALKSIIMDKLSENDQQNSVNEIRILASVSHPNIIGYKESFWDNKSKSLNIVMEYCDDGDLETKINIMKRNKQRFEEPLIWEYAIQIVEGLKALHDKKILHRDLKSANIFLVKGKNQCKIGDLNVSKVMKDNSIINSQIGTPSYSSPEVWNAEPYSYKSDLWSVGCIIYEMCSLRQPFKGKNMEELCDHICSGKIEKISSRYSEELWNMIQMLLEVDVKKRADCNTFLNSKFVKDVIDDIRSMNSELYNSTNEDEASMLDTIIYKNLRELEYKIPNKKRYGTITKLTKGNKKAKKNQEENDLDTIKNDSSFDEFSNSESRPSNNMNKNNANINNNNLNFSKIKKNKEIKGIKEIKEKKEIIKSKNTNSFERIIRLGDFNKSIKRKNKYKSCINFNIQKALNLEDEIKLKKNYSKNVINNRLMEICEIADNLRDKKEIKYKPLESNRKVKGSKKDPCNNEQNLSNNIILFPQNNLVKSRLKKNPKEDMARKISQQNLPITTFEIKPEIPNHKISNSNPKKGKKIASLKNSSKKVNDLNESSTKLKSNIKLKSFSLFNTAEAKKKMQNSKKNNETTENTEKKNKIIDLSKITIQENFQKQKCGKLKMNVLGRDSKKNNRIDINNRSEICMKAKEEKGQTGNVISSYITKNIKNKNASSNSKKKRLIKKLTHQNTEKKMIKASKFSDKYVGAIVPDILGTNKGKKDYEIKKNSKIVEIDLIRTETNGKNENSFMSSCQDINISKLINKKMNFRNSAKLNSKFYNFK